MKIYFTVTDTTAANAALSCDSIELKFDSEWHRLETILPLLANYPVFAKISSTAFGVWLKIDKDIQGVRYTTQASALTVVSPDVLAATQNEAFGQILSTTVTEFQGGKCYLIPYTAGAVTDILPDTALVGMENDADSIFVGTHYRYDCSKTHQVRNGSSFTGYVFEVNVQAITRNEHTSLKKDVVRSSEFVQKSLN